MELTCGNCQGRFIAAVPGSIVACPHCGVHLQTPTADAFAAAPPMPDSLSGSNVLSEVPVPPPTAARTSAAPEPPPAPMPIEPAAVSSGTSTSPTAIDLTPEIMPPVATEPPPAEPAQVESVAAVAPVPDAATDPPPVETTSASPLAVPAPPSPIAAPAESSGVLVATSPAEPTSSAAPGLSWVVGASATARTDAPTTFVAETEPASGVGLAAATVELQTIAPPPVSAVDAISTGEPAATLVGDLASAPHDRLQLEGGSAALESPAVALPSFATSTATARPAGVSKSAFVMTLAYAGLVTLLAAYLLFLLWRGHALESLPDLSPLGTGTVRIPAPRATVAPGHTLALGESKVFGYVKVTPLRVTRGPLELEARGPIGLENRRPSGEVLKLWLKFENVSSTDDVVPLDRQLVFYRRSDKRTPGRIMTFNFVCPKSRQKEASPPLVYMYDQPPNSNLEPKGLNLDQNLGPGQAVETFVPTMSQGASELSSELLWRVHFRKGHNAKTRAGVTTLIDIVFDSTVIESERAARG